MLIHFLAQRGFTKFAMFSFRASKLPRKVSTTDKVCFLSKVYSSYQNGRPIFAESIAPYASVWRKSGSLGLCKKLPRQV